MPSQRHPRHWLIYVWMICLYDEVKSVWKWMTAVMMLASVEARVVVIKK